jgi:hypothetical protein
LRCSHTHRISTEVEYEYTGKIVNAGDNRSHGGCLGGAVILAMCDILGALDMLKRALAINDKVLGKEHPDTIDSLDAVAAILRIYDMK